MPVYYFSFVMQYHVDIIFTKPTELEAKIGWVVFAKDWFSWLCHLACIKMLLYIFSPIFVQLIKHQESLNQFMWIFQSLPIKTSAAFYMHKPGPAALLSSLTSLSRPWQSHLSHCTQVAFSVITPHPYVSSFSSHTAQCALPGDPC